MTQEEKQQAVEILLHRLHGCVQALKAIDTRLADYFDDLVHQPDLHNGYEILGAVKFLRLLRTYHFNERRVQQIIQLREGNWEPDEQGRMHYVSGGIRCPGTDRGHVYRWQPFQVFVLASVFGFYHWFDTQVSAWDKEELLPTERENDDGMVEDLRRMHYVQLKHL